jgi:hypothetical protein
MSLKPVPVPGSGKKNKKEEKIKEIKKLCLLNSNQGNDSLNKQKNFERTQHLARDFLNECKKHLDEKSFENLIIKLLAVDKNQANNAQYLNETVSYLSDLVATNSGLERRLSAFMSCENILNHDLFLTALQYEKAIDFFQILEVRTLDEFP